MSSRIAIHKHNAVAGPMGLVMRGRGASLG